MAASCAHPLRKRLGAVGEHLRAQWGLHVALGVVVARHRGKDELAVAKARVQKAEVQGRHGVRRVAASLATVRLLFFHVLPYMIMRIFSFEL